MDFVFEIQSVGGRDGQSARSRRKGVCLTMEKIVVAGPFNASMRGALAEAIPADRYEMTFIDAPEQYAAFEDADYIILRTLSIGREDIARMKKVKLIQRWGAGFDTVDIQAAGEKGIQVAVTAGMNATPVSEMALALALAVYRNIVPLTNGIMAGRWEREAYSKRSYTLNGKRVGIYGIGNIGRKVAALYRAFGSEVIYYDPYRLPPEKEAELGVRFVQEDELWRTSDIITLHAPLTEETRGIVNRDVVARMKEGAVLINTARQELVELSAVAQALESGHLLGAGFDAIDEEVAQDNPFAGMTNVVLTTHLGGNTVDNAVHMAKRCAEQIQLVSGGGTLAAPHLVNGQYLKG